jgi:Protein of unknown function (DUF3277)
MSNVLSTYSGRDCNLALQSVLTPTIQVAGVSALGLNQVVIRMTVDQTDMKTGMDGSVVVSAVPGDMGEIEIQVWQTSTLHQLLLAWYNALKAARDSGDVSNWASSSILVTNIVDGTGHQATGVAPMKVPDKTYGAQATTVSWVLKGANIANF